jgi:hypothetical protein
VEEVRVVRVEEGETGSVESRVGEASIEALAEWYSLSAGEKCERGLPDPQSIASFLGLSPATVRKCQTDKRVLAQVKQKLDIELLYAVVELRPTLRAIAQDGKHKECLKAIRTIEELAGNLKSGPRAVVTTNVIQPTQFEAMSDEDFAVMAEDYLKGRGPHAEED